MEKPFGEMLNSIVKTVPDIIYRLDSHGIITFVSDAVKKYGYSVEELIGNNILELIHPEDREKVTYRINERRTGDRSTTFLEVRLLINKRNFGPFEDRPRGAENEPIFLITAEGLYASERPETESFRGTQGIARDITERKRAEERIKQQTEFLNLVLESLPYPFYVIDAFDYTIKVANYAAHLGRLSKETTCYALTHRSDRPCGLEGHPCPLEQVKKTKRPVTVEHIHYDKDGNPRNVEVHAYPIFDSEGNVLRIIESSLDITERKQAEEEREKLIQELQDALAKVKTLSGLLPICSSCKKIRDDKGYWNQIEAYIRDHSEADFSHSICPECAKELYPELHERRRSGIDRGQHSFDEPISIGMMGQDRRSGLERRSGIERRTASA